MSKTITTRGLQSKDLVFSHEEIARGFMFEGERWAALESTAWHLQVTQHALSPEHPHRGPKEGRVDLV